MVMLGQNARFDEFRERLEAEGYTLKPLFEATSNRRQRNKQTDVRCFAVVGSGERPAVGTLIAVDYGPDGFGLYFESSSANFGDDIATITGKPARVR